MENSGNGISFVGFLTLIFIALKLIGVIKWSWLWVIAPVWISLFIIIICLAICLILGNK